MPELYRQQHCTANGDSDSDFMEIDPTGRYGRYKEILGKGASKTVYRAFDEIEGMEVAWNQVNVRDVLQAPEDLERLYSEVHLLRTLNHENIMKFYTSWVDTKTKSINFITEMFTSGTLREYRQKHKQVDIRAIKNWARQILCGLHYLHSHDPPIIHRDLKCENIFVNGNRGEVKIGDLGLAAILRKSRLAHSVIGTPEFMAPELYDEEYNELVDIYAFGMCLLEMLTLEYPYSECSNPAQIYKKVTAGIKPDAFYKVKDPEVRQFVEKCLATACRRLPARDLLMDPFLQCNDHNPEYSLSRLGDLEHCLKGTEGREGTDCALQRNQQEADPSSRVRILNKNEQSDWKNLKVVPFPCSHENNLTNDRDFTIKGKRREDDTIFLRVRIGDKEGRVRNIYFPFDVESDTAMSVASEMVAELDITDHDVIEISDMIAEEISALVPDWKEGVAVDGCGDGEEGHSFDHSTSKSMENDLRNMFDHLSAVPSGNSQLNCLTFHNFGDNKSGSVPPTQVEGAVPGLFGEVACQTNRADISYFIEGKAPTASIELLDIHQDMDDWAHGEDPFSPSSSFSNVSGAVIFPASDESQSCCILSRTGNNPHDSSLTKSVKATSEGRLIDYTNETWEEAGWDCVPFDSCGFQGHDLSGEFSPSSYCELGCFSHSHGSQLNALLLSSFNCLSAENEDSVDRESRLLAVRHEQELLELEKKRELSVMELTACLRNEKSIRLSPIIPSIGCGSNGTCLSQNKNMTLNALQELENGHWSRYSRESKLEHQGSQVDMATMDRFTATSTRQRISGICSSRSSGSSIASPDIFSFSYQATTPPDRLIHKNSSENQRLTKMHSFCGMYCQSYMTSMAAEMNRRLYQAFGEFGTKALNITQDFPRGMR